MAGPVRGGVESVVFFANTPVLDDPGNCPGGQLRAERAKVMSSCGKMINLSLSLFNGEGRMHSEMRTDNWLHAVCRGVVKLSHYYK